jgi:hypothetical protein
MCAEDPDVAADVGALVDRFGGALADLAEQVSEDNRLSDEVSGYFATVAGWFLASAFPIDTNEFAELVDRLPPAAREHIIEHLSAVHEGMFGFVCKVDPMGFPWGERRVPLHDVSVEYFEALRAPTLRTVLDYLRACEVAGRRCALEGDRFAEILAPTVASLTDEVAGGQDGSLLFVDA